MRYKITPEVDKALKILCSHMPEMHVTDRNTGKVLLQKFTTVELGDAIPKADRAKMHDWDANKRYTLVSTRPVKVNHYIVLIDIYKKCGDKGIEDYLEVIQGHLDYESVLRQAQKGNESVWKKFLNLIKVK